MHECDICNKLFSTRKRRKRHRKRIHAHLECLCRRKFVFEYEMKRHKTMMRKNAKAYPCAHCCLSFDTEEGIQQHIRRYKHLLQSNDERKSYFDEFYKENVKVDKEDMTASRKIADTLLRKMMSHVRNQPGGTIFNPNFIKAGSVPVNAKIGKADEFDTNIELNVTPTEIRRHGQLNYDYVDSEDTSVPSMKVIRELEKSSERKSIPEGFAAVKVDKGSVPDTYLHGQDIIPRQVKQDLYNKMETAENELALTCKCEEFANFSKYMHESLTFHIENKFTIFNFILTFKSSI
ncbi:uncharacterized protein LOC123550923 [Mercenaria mercenaria]|uniref:uncharacterized protein LOC123550923 n=1 Tax=Mercenaria mercenaria TaxID=6596 RepID=UPI00234F5DFE|nr:uncharacterized protein LOC123550923 [Mercenaria mercenaria]